MQTAQSLPASRLDRAVAAALCDTGISGVANILPLTCMPGTLITSVSDMFRREHRQLPWVNIAFDGQQEVGIETRLQAFMFQAREFARRYGYDEARVREQRGG
jgi:predicted nucleotide-binding protein (sugar kinase/HSP70/actin superfamily)